MTNNKKIASKTLSTKLNGGKPSPGLMKALKLGQTKVKNGVTFVVKMTPSGKLDWRVLKGKDKPLLTTEELFDTKDFPELDDLKVVSALGGSTGAQLVEDSKGNQFVMKKGASKEHVEEEFLANSIYKVMGIEVPTMKLYKGTTESTILSRYMPETVAANDMMDDQTRDDIAKNYVLDCFLGNWDIYKNDNILINTEDGSLVRVDNGGSMRFSAQGRPKGDAFGPEVLEIDTMAENNPYIASALTDAKMKQQVKKILVKGENILSLIEDKELKDVMYERLMDLKSMVSDTIKDPNRELKEREIKRCLRKAGSLTNIGQNGWSFLSEVGKVRGFDEVPTIMDDDEFDELLKDEKTIMLNRGLTGSSGKTAMDYMTDFTEGEDCFYGTLAMYGAGIYAAVNAQKNTPPPHNADYDIALSYAGYDKNHVMDIIIPPDAKVADGDELDKMMNEEFFGDEFKELKDDYDQLKDDYNDLMIKKEKIEDEIDGEVKEQLGWNEKTWKTLLKSKPENVYAKGDEYDFNKVLNYYQAVMGSINGTITKLDDKTYEVKVPNNANKFYLSSFTSELAMKQKNESIDPYNHHFTKLKNFVLKEHFLKIKGKVDGAIKENRRTDPKMMDIQTKIKDSETGIKALSDKINEVKNNGAGSVSNEVIAEIIKHPGGTYRGFYAAIKGYDAIISKKGWGTDTDFAIILNRSKMVVRNFKK